MADDLAAQIKTEFESYKATVDARDAAQAATIASQGESITALEAKIAAFPPGVDMTALQADLDEIKAANAALTTPVADPAAPAT